MNPYIFAAIIIVFTFAVGAVTVWNMIRHSKVSLKQIIITWFKSKFKI